MQVLSSHAQPRSTAQAKLLIQTTEDLKQWSTQLVLQRRKLRVTQAHVLGTLADVVTDPEMDARLAHALDRAEERRFTGETITGFGELA